MYLIISLPKSKQSNYYHNKGKDDHSEYVINSSLNGNSKISREKVCVEGRYSSVTASVGDVVV